MARQRANESKTLPVPTEYECELCRDEGVVVVIKETGERVPVGDKRLWTDDLKMKPHTFSQCGCAERKRIERIFKSSRITEEFRSVGFKNYVVDGRPACVKHARDTALDYFKRFHDIKHTDENSILLHGHPGSGKTHLLMAVCNGLMRQGVSVQYFPWAEGFNDLRDNLDELAERVSTMANVDLLFIDDLYKGRKAPTDFMIEQLVVIVYKRYLEHKPMIICSERTKEEMFAIDEGIARRIHERSRGHRVLMMLTPEEKAAGMELNYSLAREDGV